MERAKKSKEKAAREAMEVQGLIRNTSVNGTTISSAGDPATLTDTTPTSSASTSDRDPEATSTSLLTEISIDE